MIIIQLMSPFLHSKITTLYSHTFVQFDDVTRDRAQNMQLKFTLYIVENQPCSHVGGSHVSVIPEADTVVLFGSSPGLLLPTGKERNQLVCKSRFRKCSVNFIQNLTKEGQQPQALKVTESPHLRSSPNLFAQIYGFTFHPLVVDTSCKNILLNLFTQSSKFSTTFRTL